MPVKKLHPVFPPMDLTGVVFAVVLGLSIWSTGYKYKSNISFTVSVLKKTLRSRSEVK